MTRKEKPGELRDKEKIPKTKKVKSMRVRVERGNKGKKEAYTHMSVLKALRALPGVNIDSVNAQISIKPGAVGIRLWGGLDYLKKNGWEIITTS